MSECVRFDDDQRKELRQRLLQRGGVLATLLSDVLAGKDKPIELERILRGRPGMRPEEALRKALDQVEQRRELLDRDDDRYGRCAVCGVDLGLTVLEEMAWADRCEMHTTQ